MFSKHVFQKKYIRMTQEQVTDSRQEEVWREIKQIRVALMKQHLSKKEKFTSSAETM